MGLYSWSCCKCRIHFQTSIYNFDFRYRLDLNFHLNLIHSNPIQSKPTHNTTAFTKQCIWPITAGLIKSTKLLISHIPIALSYRTCVIDWNKKLLYYTGDERFCHEAFGLLNFALIIDFIKMRPHCRPHWLTNVV